MAFLDKTRTTTMIPKKLLAGLLISALGLTACGGGSDKTDNGYHPGDPLAAGYILDINAATGEAMANATVTVKDVNGVQVSGTTDLLGWSYPVVGGMKPPLMIKVTSQDGLTSEYGYVFKDNVGAPAVNTFTSMAIALAARQNPGTAFSGFGAGVDATVDANIEAAANSLFTAFAPVFTTLGVTTTSSTMFKIFPTDHTGLDRVLDAIQVQMTGAQILIKDKLGTTLATFDASAGTVPALTSSTEVAESADAYSGIATLLAQITTDCGTPAVSNTQTCLAHFAASGFLENSKTAPIDITDGIWLDMQSINTWDFTQINRSAPDSVVYGNPILFGKSGSDYKVRLTYTASDGTNTSSFMDDVFVFQDAADGNKWKYKGNQLSLWLDSDYNSSAGQNYFSVSAKSHGSWPSSVDHVVVTGPGLPVAGLTLSVPASSNSSGNYKIQNCVPLNANASVCSNANQFTASNLLGTSQQYTFIAYDNTNTALPVYSGTYWLYLRSEP
jgi:hypothetical protein